MLRTIIGLELSDNGASACVLPSGHRLSYEWEKSGLDTSQFATDLQKFNPDIIVVHIAGGGYRIDISLFLNSHRNHLPFSIADPEKVRQFADHCAVSETYFFGAEALARYGQTVSVPDGKPDFIDFLKFRKHYLINVGKLIPPNGWNDSDYFSNCRGELGSMTDELKRNYSGIILDWGIDIVLRPSVTFIILVAIPDGPLNEKFSGICSSLQNNWMANNVLVQPISLSQAVKYSNMLY